MPKRRKPLPQGTHELYVVTVTGWELSWNFSVADLKRESGPYREYTTLTFSGDVIYPHPFKYPKARIDLSGRTALDKDDPISAQRGLGSVSGAQRSTPSLFGRSRRSAGHAGGCRCEYPVGRA
jgi:hypothetical protein